MFLSCTSHLATSGANRQAAIQLGISSESCIRYWKKQQAAIEAAPRHKRIVSRRQTSKWPQIEVQVCSYIEELRNKGLCVSQTLIWLEALRVADTLQVIDFKASEGWCTRFMRGHQYTLRAPTNIAQVLPQHWADKITDDEEELDTGNEE